MNPARSLYDQSHFAVVGGGADRVRVCVTELGASASSSKSSPGAPLRRVLLIHGNPSHLDHWLHTVPALRKRAAVLAFDQPGLGRSDDFADAKQRLERSVDITLAVLDHAGWTEPVDIIGQSHGGLVAVGLAARAPERVRSVVLLGTGGTPSHPMYRLFRLPGLDHLLHTLGRVMSPKKPPPVAAKAHRWFRPHARSPGGCTRVAGRVAGESCRRCHSHRCDQQFLARPRAFVRRRRGAAGSSHHIANDGAPRSR